MKLLFTGGGTAGHIFPILAIVREIKKNYSYDGFEFFYLGPKDKYAKDLLEKEGIIVRNIVAGKVRRYFSVKNVFDIFKLPVGLLQSIYYVFIISPDAIFSKGGYGALGPGLAGAILGVPIFLHESDVVPGLANKIVSKFALEVFIAFSAEETEYFPEEKKLSVGNPISTELLNGSQKDAKKTYGITGEKPVVLIIGGSQGSARINNTILANLPEIIDDFEVIHQTGRNNLDQVGKEAKVILGEREQAYYHPKDFLSGKDLADAYATADLVISRAGAGSIFEIAALGKPGILIPLAGSAQDHQVRNAYTYAERGAALVIEEPNFKPHFILERMRYLINDPKKMKEMSQRALDFARPEAAKIVAGYLVSYLS